jgi:protein O-mannosyl-transferase
MSHRLSSLIGRSNCAGPLRNNRTVLSVALIVSLGLLAYSNSFLVPFFYDDHTSITANPLIRTLGNFLSGSSGYNYNPRRFLPYLSFAVNYQFGGFNVAGYHIFNLAVHLGCALLVYALLRLTLKTPFFGSQGLVSRTSGTEPGNLIPLLAALLFVVHPVQTQAVTYVVQRMTSMASFFFLLAIIFYILARQRFEARFTGCEPGGPIPEPGEAGPIGARTRTVPVLLLFGSVLSSVLAMRSKEIAFTLPIAVLLYETYFFRGEWKRRLLYLAPILMTLPIIPLSILSANGSTGALLADVSLVARVETAIPRLDYFLTQFRVIATYLRLLVFPVHQNLEYDYPIYSTFFTPPVFLSFLLLVALFVLAVYLYFRTRRSFYSNLNIQPSTFNDPALLLVSFGILWFFLTLAVESSLIPITDVIFEHRIYLPSVGAFTAVAAIFGILVNKIRKRGLARGLMVVVAGMILVLTAATWQRNQVWQSAVSLWQDVVAKSPQKARPYLSLGAALGKAGRMEEAIAALKRAVLLQPDDPKLYVNLGAAQAATGRRPEAIETLSKALKLDPDHPEALNNLGIVLKDVGRLEDSIAALTHAVRIDPENARAWYNLGQSYVQAGQVPEALTSLQRAIRLQPDYDNARIVMAGALNRDGRFKEAASLLIPEMQRMVNRPDARLVLGTASYCLGDSATASRELAALQQLDPRYARELETRMGRSCDTGPSATPQ